MRMRRICNLPSPFTRRREIACFGVVWKCEYVFLYFSSNLSAKWSKIINISTDDFYKVCVSVILTKIFGFVDIFLRDVLTMTLHRRLCLLKYLKVGGTALPDFQAFRGHSRRRRTENVAC